VFMTTTAAGDSICVPGGGEHESNGFAVGERHEADGVTIDQKRRSLELFESDIALALRERASSRPLCASAKLKEAPL
jgi:hypothetical protein